ncbi:hypothetical protein AnigIFM60653_009932 [Aspergillus niger]|nr:hypothetical protein AnigIFM60653_009932 [Aspergillus niger]
MVDIYSDTISSLRSEGQRSQKEQIIPQKVEPLTEYHVPEEQPPGPEYPPEPEYPVPEEQPTEPEYPVPEEQPPEPEFSPEPDYTVSEERPFGKMVSGPSVSITELPEDIRLYVNWTNLGIEERKQRKKILKQKNLPVPHRDGTFS